jgi:hypothetical protein
MSILEFVAALVRAAHVKYAHIALAHRVAQLLEDCIMGTPLFTEHGRVDRLMWDTVRARPGRLSAISVSHSKSIFAWRFCMGAQGA